MRVFFALMPPPMVASALAAVAAGVLGGRERAVPVANYHVTLAFVGRVDAAGLAACRDAGACVQGEPFALDLDAAGAFPRARVAWLAPAAVPPALDALVAGLRAALARAAVACDPKPFRCHLTIARDIRAPLPAQTVSRVRWPVADFALVESVSDAAGVRYETRAKWPLRPACRDETAALPVQ